MNSIIESTWDVMEANSVFGIGFFELMSTIRDEEWREGAKRNDKRRIPIFN